MAKVKIIDLKKDKSFVSQYVDLRNTHIELLLTTPITIPETIEWLLNKDIEVRCLIQNNILIGVAILYLNKRGEIAFFVKERVLRLIAPGSADVWYPALPEAAALLGSGPRPVSLDPATTAEGLLLATGLLALALLSVPPLVRSDQARRAAAVVVAGAAALAIYGIVARSRFGALLYGQFAVPTVSPFGPFVSKNHFAGYVEMAALLAAGLAAGLASENRSGPGPLGWIESPRAPRVMLAAEAAAVLALAVPVSLSRGGSVSLVAGLASFLLFTCARTLP